MVRKITQVRSEYTSARVIASNLDHRLAGKRFERPPGYLPPEVDTISRDGTAHTLVVRDCDVRHLSRMASDRARNYLALILEARSGNPAARARLEAEGKKTHDAISARFNGSGLVENEYIVPYTTSRVYSDAEISNKGAILLDLSLRGIATADFCILAGKAYRLPREEHESCLRTAVRNLEILSGRRLENPDNPLLIAMRSAMPDYIPGFMPTYLNVGLIPEMLPGLRRRYGRGGAARIRLNNRKTILEALSPKAYLPFETEIRPHMPIDPTEKLSVRLENAIQNLRPDLLSDAFAQLTFFLRKAYDFYEDHLDVFRNFPSYQAHSPSVILQRMVCSVIDRSSYAGVISSRHPKRGSGVYLQVGRKIFGEDLMTGRLSPKERLFHTREESRREFPAVFHCWDRLSQLESIFRAPVMVEFTGVRGAFTILQANPAELSGAGMITAVMDMHRAGRISEERVRELIKPYHVRQIESDAIDPKSFPALTKFCRGLPVLPRSAVVGRIFLAADRARKARNEPGGGHVILVKESFTPTEAMDMRKVDGICSLSPAAVHIISTAQSLGIPALFNLEESGVRIDPIRCALVNRDGLTLPEGSWVTLSSRFRTLFAGKARFAPARLLRYMAGEALDLKPAEEARFRRMAEAYRGYRKILENPDTGAFESLQDIGHAVHFGRLSGDAGKAEDFVTRCFDRARGTIVRRLLEATLGTHFLNQAAFALLSPERQGGLLKDALKICSEREVSGYHAGAFVIGSLVRPDAAVAFWKAFTPSETARLINEWVLHRKYLNILNDVGEKRINRARTLILSRGLGELWMHAGLVSDFMTLKLAGVAWDDIRRALAPDFDPQTSEAVDLLSRPFSAFYDFHDPGSVARLKALCDIEGLPLPRPDDL